MHESIATALYKGEVRQYESRVDALGERFSRLPWVGRRGPWFRQTATWFEMNPAFVKLGQASIEHKKHGELYLYGLVAPRSMTGQYAWEGTKVRLRKKFCDVAVQELPLRVTHHCVKRIMQRGNDVDPVRALRRRLAMAFHYACFLERTPSADSILLPVVGGAVVAAADRDDPSLWVFLTFIDAEKLRPEQKREAMRTVQRIKGMSDGVDACELRIDLSWVGGFPEVQFA